MTTLHAIEQPSIANAEAEAMLCGALMYENRLIDGIADRLDPEDFSDPFFGRLFSLIVKERSLGHSPNPVTLRPFYDADEAAILIGLTGTSGVQTIAAKDCAGQIRSLARRRRLAEGLQAVLADARSADRPLDEVIADAESAVSEAADDTDDGVAQLSGGECISRVLTAMETNDPGVQSGIGTLDHTLGAIRRRNLVIVGGRPGMGKSALAISYAIGATRKGHGVLLVSLEMSAEEIGERMAADLCFETDKQVPYGVITGGKLSIEQGRQVARAGEYLAKLPLTVIDIGTATLARLNGLVRRHKRRMAANGHKLELVIVDYLQLVRPDHRTSGLYEAITEVSRGLKALAKTHDVGVMALTQLSRKVEERHDKRPHMADLRDSGQIEQDADAILFLYRPEYYLRQAEPQNPADHAEWEESCQREAGKLEFIVAKRRRGPSGTAEGRYYTAFQAVRG